MKLEFFVKYDLFVKYSKKNFFVYKNTLFNKTERKLDLNYVENGSNIIFLETATLFPVRKYTYDLNIYVFLRWK